MAEAHVFGVLKQPPPITIKLNVCSQLVYQFMIFLFLSLLMSEWRQKCQKGTVDVPQNTWDIRFELFEPWKTNHHVTETNISKLLHNKQQPMHTTFVLLLLCMIFSGKLRIHSIPTRIRPKEHRLHLSSWHLLPLTYITTLSSKSERKTWRPFEMETRFLWTSSIIYSKHQPLFRDLRNLLPWRQQNF